MRKLRKKKKPVSVIIEPGPPKPQYQIYGIAIWKIIVGITILAAFIPTCIAIVESQKTPHEKYIDKNFDSGALKGPVVDTTNIDTSSSPEWLRSFHTEPVKDSSEGSITLYPPVIGIHIPNFNNIGSININAGTFSINISTQKFKEGFGLFQLASTEWAGSEAAEKVCPNIDLKFGAKDDRVYAAVKLLDLQGENEMGRIEYNRWKVFHPNLLDYSYTDTSLKIIDKQGYVAFSLKYFSTTKEIKILGYLISPTNCVVMTEKQSSCSSKKDSSWKKNAQITLSGIED